MDLKRLDGLGVEDEAGEPEEPRAKTPRRVPPAAEHPDDIYQRFRKVLEAKRLEAAWRGTPLHTRARQEIRGKILETVAAAVLGEPQIQELLQTLRHEFDFDCELALQSAGFSRVETSVRFDGRHDFLRKLCLELIKLYVSNAIFYLGLEDASLAAPKSIREHLSILAEHALMEAEKFRKRAKDHSGGIVTYENQTVRQAITDLGKFHAKIEAMQKGISITQGELDPVRDRLLNREFV